MNHVLKVKGALIGMKLSVDITETKLLSVFWWFFFCTLLMIIDLKVKVIGKRDVAQEFYALCCPCQLLHQKQRLNYIFIIIFY